MMPACLGRTKAATCLISSLASSSSTHHHLFFSRSLVGVKVRYGSNYRDIWGTREKICWRSFQAYLSVMDMCVYVFLYQDELKLNKLWISFKLVKVVGCVRWKQWVKRNRLWTYHSPGVPAALTAQLCDLLLYRLHEIKLPYQHYPRAELLLSLQMFSPDLRVLKERGFDYQRAAIKM